MIKNHLDIKLNSNFLKKIKLVTIFFTCLLIFDSSNFNFANAEVRMIVEDELLVKFKDDASSSEITELIGFCNTDIKLDSNSMIDEALKSSHSEGELPPELSFLIRQIFWLTIQDPIQTVEETITCFENNSEIVEFAEPNVLSEPDSHQSDSYPNDTRFLDGSQWSLFNWGQKDSFENLGIIDADIDVVQSWDLPHTDCRNVIVAVLDNGVDLDHPDLAPNLWVNPNEILGNGVDDDGNFLIDDVHGFDFTEFKIVLEGLTPKLQDRESDGPEDSVPLKTEHENHGTAVAGIIGAKGNGGDPGGISGICWDAKLMIMRIGAPIFDYNAILFATIYIVLEKFLFDQNIRIINLSDSEETNTKTIELISDITTLSKILFIVTPGNLGNNIDLNGAGKPGRFPCSLLNPNIICVAASNNRDELWSSSSYGSSSVDLAAPGENIISLRRGLQGGGTTDGTGSGTSFAVPHVSGIAALAFSLFPDKGPMDVKKDILEGSIGSTPSSGVDIVNKEDPDTIFGKVLSDGRLRWPYTGDLGDAPDSYHTIAETSRGALHWDIGNEFIGDDVTPEVDANKGGKLDQDKIQNLVDMDRSDDWETFAPTIFFFDPEPPWRQLQFVGVNYKVCTDYLRIEDADKGRYQAVKMNDKEPTNDDWFDRSIFVNGFFDVDKSGDFEPDELLLEDIITIEGNILPKPDKKKQGYPQVTVNIHELLPIPNEIPPPNPPEKKCVFVNSVMRIPPDDDIPPQGVKPDWIRFRLDYGEDIGENDPLPLFQHDTNLPLEPKPPGHFEWARHGEVEDITLQTNVSGTILPIDSTALFLSGLSQSAVWMIPTVLGIAGAGVIIRHKLQQYL